MNGVSSWILGAFLVVFGIVGLFLSSRAEDSVFYYTGLLFFGFAVLFIFGLIARHTAEDPQS